MPPAQGTSARLMHASATPSTLDLILRKMEDEEVVPIKEHVTDYETRLRYVIGVRYRRASLEFMLTTPAEVANFRAFYRSVTNANTRFTFIADVTNFGSDTWSAYFIGTPEFDHRQMPGARKVETVKVTIHDAPTSL